MSQERSLSAAPIGVDRQYVTIGIASETIAIAVAQVQEVLDVQPFIRIPNMPAVVRGMIDVRRRAIPVFDLRLKFGLSATEETPQTRIVVLDLIRDGALRRVGILADRVFEVTELDQTNVDPPPDIGMTWQSQAVVGLGRRNGALVIVLDVNSLFDADDLPPALSAASSPALLPRSGG